MPQTMGNQQWDELKPTLKSFITESQRAKRTGGKQLTIRRSKLQ